MCGGGAIPSLANVRVGPRGWGGRGMCVMHVREALGASRLREEVNRKNQRKNERVERIGERVRNNVLK